jgi:hypothetical protein
MYYMKCKKSKCSDLPFAFSREIRMGAAGGELPAPAACCFPFSRRLSFFRVLSTSRRSLPAEQAAQLRDPLKRGRTLYRQGCGGTGRCGEAILVFFSRLETIGLIVRKSYALKSVLISFA